jgi:xanthine dehydrogenase accessory factor
MDLYGQMAQLIAEGRSFVLATVIDSGGSTPQKPGAKMVVLADGSVRGTVGGGAIEYQIVQASLEILRTATATRVIETHLTHDLGMCCGGKMKVFLEKNEAPGRVWIFGAGHVAKELATLAKHVGFWVCVIDERPDWATRDRFPDVDQLTIKNPADVAKELTGGERDYFCITTHDHPLDQAILEWVLRKPAAYIGVIGSRRKAERFKMRLNAAGFSPEELARVRSPMGVPIQALTTEEIAVSIVGELIQVRRNAEEKAAPRTT